jgi:hypothetical protein
MPIQAPKKIQDINAYNSIRDIISEINRETDVLAVNVTVPGTEVAVPHQLNYIPASWYQVRTELTTGTGTMANGTTAWTATNIYVTADAVGLYHIRVRR